MPEAVHAAALTAAAGPDEAAEPETVSGDANVAAIEDVPRDRPLDGPQDGPQDEDVDGDVVPAEPAADAASETAAVPKPAVVQPAPSIPASVALREAAGPIGRAHV